MRRLFAILALILVFGIFCACQSGSGNNATDTGGGSSSGADTGPSDKPPPDADDDAGAKPSPSPTPPPTPPPAPTSEPTILDNFTSRTTLWPASESHGNAEFGVADASAEDGYATKIFIVGDESKNYGDLVGPSKGSRMGTSSPMGYGRYEVRARAESALCNSDEEVITGIFFYSNDGVDADGNGVIDNREVDIEFACSDPTRLMLTVWTDYDELADEHSRNVSRIIKMDEGTYRDRQRLPDVGKGDRIYGAIDLSKVGTFEPYSKYYVYGFELSEGHIRFFINAGNGEVTLWDFPNAPWDASFVPKSPMQFMMNVWHPGSRWFNTPPTEADYPASDQALYVDWFKYWE